MKCIANAKVQLLCETSGYYNYVFRNANIEYQWVATEKGVNNPINLTNIFLKGQSWVKGQAVVVVYAYLYGVQGYGVSVA